MAEEKKRKRRKKKGIGEMMPRFEVLFIAVMFLCFLIWAVSKCSSSQLSPRVTTPNEVPDDIESPAAADNPNSPTYELDETPTSSETTTSTTSGAPNGNVEIVGRTNGNNNNITPVKRGYTPLYVTLQDLKVRRGPSRDSAIVSKLNLNEEVMFMEKRTNFREKINIGNTITDEPWVFVRTKKGREGWVYGAGVHYFKWDRLKDPIPSLFGDEELEEEE